MNEHWGQSFDIRSSLFDILWLSFAGSPDLTDRKGGGIVHNRC